MYKCVQDYSPAKEMDGFDVLDVKRGNTLEFLESYDENWWKMRSVDTGKVGLVAVKYMKEVKQGAKSDIDMDEKTSVLLSIDRAIQAIYQDAGDDKKLDQSSRVKLQKLVDHRKRTLSSYQNEKSSSGDKHSSRASATYSLESNIPLQPSRPAPDLARQGEKGFSKKKLAPEPPVECNIKIPPKIGSELVEQIRVSTGLSYYKCIVAVETMLVHIQHNVPSISHVADYILESLYNSQENSERFTDEELLATHDGQQLQALVDELIKFKDDFQQRSWAVHEDKSVIGKCLEDVLSILQDANPLVCLAVVQQDSFNGLLALVQYYQMEPRTSLRLLLLKIFCGCCGLGKEVMSQLLYTILPVELARDMQADTQDIEKLLLSARLSTMIFSTGEAIPYQHYEYLNKPFIEFLVNTIENPPDTGEEDRICDVFVPLILSYNQHFGDVKKNIVMEVLSEKGTSKVLTEQLMLLVNREDDPVNIFAFLDQCPNSILKFFEDIFSSHSTSGIFFKNDLMVLIDIVLRKANDLQPGDKLRTEYLSLLHGILSTTNYSEYKHQCNEIFKCLKRISEEESQEVEKDKLIVREILKTFTNIFPT